MSKAIEITGLQEIVQILSTTPDMSYLLPDLNSYMLQLNYKLSDEVDRNYFTPYPLEDLYLGVRIEASRSNTIVAGLSYKDKRVPLAEYPHTTQTLDTRNAIPYGRTNKAGESKISYIPVNKARSVRVRIRKNGGGNVSRVRTKFSKFLVNSDTGNFIAARKSKETWLEIPTLGADGRIEGGIRTPIQPLFGPSLVELGENVFKNNSNFDGAVSIIMDKMIAKLAKYYA